MTDKGFICFYYMFSLVRISGVYSSFDTAEIFAG